MLKTVLLLDGGEAMNSTSDYQPNYLLAVRQPLLRYVRTYLHSTTLASLGVVVMRDGVARSLLSCTTNVQDVLHTLETDYFLYGGSGCISLENGLRAALAELLDCPQAVLQNHKGKPHAARVDAMERRVLLFSASVTVIDPTDVLRVVRLMARADIEVNVISLLGAVHVFHECAVQTKGTFYCPRNYAHLRQILGQLAVGHVASPRGGSNEDGRHTQMIPVGFPVSITLGQSSSAVKQESPLATAPTPKTVLVCPECSQPQSSIPSTCRRCSLRLCSVPFIYAMLVARHDFLPPTHRKRLRSADEWSSPHTVAAPPSSCGLCAFASQTEVECKSCGVARCAACQQYCEEVLRMCPTCVGLQ